MSNILTFDKTSNNINYEDYKIIVLIADRALKDYKEHGIELDRVSLEMDLIAVHGGCQKLDLNKLLKFDDFNFTHDISGIKRHLNRKAIKLEDCFLPRCSI